MRDYWDITFGPADPKGKGRDDYIGYSVPDSNLNEVTQELADTFGDNWSVLDCEDWEGLDLKTRRFSPQEIWQIAEIANMQESPRAFIAWLGDRNAVSLGIPDDLQDQFRKAYRGEYEDYTEFAQEWAKDNAVDEVMWPHVDWEKFGRALAYDYTVLDLSTGKVAMFSNS